jgi:hypothetical protein
MDVSFLMSRYDAEVKRKDQITSAVSVPVTILTFLGSVIATMAKSLSLETVRSASGTSWRWRPGLA